MVQEKPINQHLTPSVKKSKLSKSNVLFFTHQTDEKIKDGYDLGEHADGETSFLTERWKRHKLAQLL